MSSLIQKLKNRLTEIDERLFKVKDQETKRLKKYKFANESGCLKLIRHFK